jgi:uncharacterized protein (TIGR03067 family)
MKWLTVFCVALALNSAPARLFAGDNSLDEKLDGEWDLISFEKDGKKVPEEDFKGMKVRFTSSPGTVTVTKGEKTLAEGTVEVDRVKQPKTINVTITSEGAKKGKTSLGIYRVDGDSLTLCFDDSGKVRPKEFASKPGSGHDLRKYTRSVR